MPVGFIEFQNPNTAVEWGALLLRIRGVRVQMSARNPPIVSVGFHEFPQALQVHSTSFRPLPLPSEPFQIHYSLAILQFDGI
jgi:hypothetical protein